MADPFYEAKIQILIANQLKYMQSLSEKQKKHFPFKEEHVEEMVRRVLPEKGMINQVFDWTTSPIGEPLKSDHVVTYLSGIEDGIPEMTLDMQPVPFNSRRIPYHTMAASMVKGLPDISRIAGEEILRVLIAEELRNSLSAIFLRAIRDLLKIWPHQTIHFDTQVAWEETKEGDEDATMLKAIKATFAQTTIAAEHTMYREISRGGVTHIISGTGMDAYWRMHPEFDKAGATQPVFVHRTGSLHGIETWRGPRNLVDEVAGFYIWKNPNLSEDRFAILGIKIPFMVETSNEDPLVQEFSFEGDYQILNHHYVREVRLANLPLTN